MTIAPRDLLAFASQLLNEHSEVAQRAAASRAYYGAYHLGRQVQAHFKIPLADAKRDAGVHENMIVALERCGGLPRAAEVKVQTLGTLLRQCRDLRTEADYHIDQDFSAGKATSTVSISRRAEKLALELLK
jgi:uncharacterized protein (UPF0332 family)